jgi:hypothetical protein
MGDALEVARCAEEFNQPAYAVNVFPTGTGDNSFTQVLLQGNVVLVNAHVNEQGECVARVYNPTEKEEHFSLQIGEMQVQAKAAKAEVVSIVFKDGEGFIFHNEMPV